jgi:alpha-1,2-mannosyltransferase
MITPDSIAAAAKRSVIIGLLWVLALSETYSTFGQLPQNASKLDFSVYYLSATVTYHGDNPYLTDFEPLARKLGLEVGWIRHATDPPSFLLCIAPLALMPQRLAYYTWAAGNIVMFIAAVVWLLCASSLGLSAALLLGALALLYPPVQFHLFMGQSKMVILLLLVAMLRAMQREWDRTAGLCLAFAGLLRIFPLLLVFYLAIQRRWRVLAWTLIGLAAGGLATIAVFTPAKSLSFLKGMALLTDRRLFIDSANISLRAAVTRLFSLITWPAQGAKLDTLIAVVTVAIESAVVGSAIWATIRLGPREDPDWRAFSLWIIVSVLISPVAWLHYMVLFLIPLIQLTSAAGLGRASRRAEWWGIASYLLLILFPWLFRTAMNWDSRQGQPTTLITVMYLQCIGAALAAYFSAYWFAVDTRVPIWKACKSI